MTVDSPAKQPRSSREDVLQFLDSLDSYSAPSRPSTTGATTSSNSNSTSTAPAHHSSSTEPSSSSTPSSNNPLSSSTSSSATQPVPSSSSSIPSVTNAEEAQSVLDFLDEITQRSSTPTAPVKQDQLHSLAKKSSLPGGLSRSGSRTNVHSIAQSRKSGESVRSQRSNEVGTTTATTIDASAVPIAVAPAAQAQAPAPAPAPAASEGGWGWSSVWSQASNVVQQATHVVQQARDIAEEQVKTNAAGLSGGLAGGIGGIGEGLMKALGENEQAKKWSEGVVNYARGAQLDQIGNNLKSTTLRSLTELLNAVAPPIAEHEVLQVSLSHDMLGYEGVETLVYSSLSKIMEQIEGGSLVVNKGEEEKPKPHSEDPDDRDLHAVEGLAEGWKLAEANLDELIKHSYKPSSPDSSKSSSTDSHNRSHSLTIPVTTCPIYIRIQPCVAPLPFFPSRPAPPPSADGSSIPAPEPSKHLFFLFILKDPTHKLEHETLSQALPVSWLDVPFEENEWVEDMMVDVLRKGIEAVGKEYIDTRMHAQSIAINKAREAAQQALSQSESHTPVPAEEKDTVTVAASLVSPGL